jgi:hypothetical protein
MRAARPFLLTSSEVLRPHNSSHFRSFSAFLRTESKRIPCIFNYFRTLLRKHPGVIKNVFFNLQLFNSVRPNSFRFRTYRRSSCFDRNRPKLSVRKPRRISIYTESRCNSFRSNTYKKPGGGVTHQTSPSPTILSTTSGGGEPSAADSLLDRVADSSWFGPRKWCNLPTKHARANRFALRPQL